MKIRQIDLDKDYIDVAKWWAKQGWPVLTKEILGKVGFIAEIDDKKVAAVWIFATNSPIYVMEWLVGNPDVDHEKRALGIDLVVEAACNWAKDDGATSVFTTTNHERLIEKYKARDFKVTDTNMTSLMRGL